MARYGDGIYQRGRTWWLDFTHEGKRHVARIGKGISRTVAREIAQVKRAAILKGEAGIGRKRKDLPFDVAAEELLAWAAAEKRPNTVAAWRSCLKALRVSFARLRLSEITPGRLEQHKQARVAQGARVMVNRELSCLRLLYNRALRQGRYEGPNPVRAVGRLAESGGRLRFLEPEEEQRLLAELSEPYRTLALVGLYAGLRLRSEALPLTWRDVDLIRGRLTVPSEIAKNGRSRTLTLNSVLLPAMRALKARPLVGEHIFLRRDGRPLRHIQKVFMGACRRAGPNDVTPHVLRHTFASRLAMAGVPLRTIMELGGWSSLDMVQRYSHLSPEHQAEALERLAQFPSAFHNTPPASRSQRAASAGEITPNARSGGV